MAPVKSVEVWEGQEPSILQDIELDGLRKMRMLNKEFLAKNKGSKRVRDYLARTISDDALMLVYLKGRKYRPDHAWETLKRKAEVKFEEYPEVFNPDPGLLKYHENSGIWGILKNRDRHGRRILCFQGCKWDPSEVPLTDITTAGVHIIDKFLLDKDALDNGVVYIQDCEGMGFSYVKHYTLPGMLRTMNVFWYACPLKFKALYFINVPTYLTYIYGTVKPFLSKKLKERVIITTTSKKYELLHTRIDPAILPKYLGGELKESEAFETGYLC